MFGKNVDLDLVGNEGPDLEGLIDELDFCGPVFFSSQGKDQAVLISAEKFHSMFRKAMTQSKSDRT